MSWVRQERIWALQRKSAPYVFVAPFVLAFATFMVYPLGHSIWLAFRFTNGPQTSVFVGRV